ncbi:MAG: YeeE/YedE family protein [Rhodobacterales bacterium]|nr:YeeE/YedE family protein [Rhodobacterales bacterium]
MIEIMREMVIESPGFYIMWGGLAIATVFGYIVYVTNFCTMGSISDFMSFGDFRRFRSWLLAAAVAMVGVAILQKLEVADYTTSMYMSTNLTWLANISGGLIFGIGMVLSGGCLSKNLVRAGSGDMRSALVLVVAGLFAYMTIGGLLGPLRIALFGDAVIDLAELGMETQGFGEFVRFATGLDGAMATNIALAILAGGIAIYCFMDAGFRKSPAHVIAGIGIGLCVVAGWALTGLAQDDFADVPVQLISLSYVRPAGDTLDYLMRATAYEGPGFNVMTFAGVLLGGFLGALSKGRLSLSTFSDKDDTRRNMIGAAMMGFGGVVALGCTIGQGVTGFSTLAVGSGITLVFIVLGGIIGIKYMEWSLMRD